MNILVCGASWSTGTVCKEVGFCWATQVEKELDARVTNLSMDGASIDYVVRTIITELEINDYDYVIVAMPILTNRFELIARTDKENKFLFTAMHGVPTKQPFYGAIVDPKRNNAVNDWTTHIVNDYYNEYNSYKNIALLGQYLQIKNVKHLMLFDLKPNALNDLHKCTINTNLSIMALRNLAKKYISFTDYMSLYVDDMFMDKTLHPCDEGHILLGKMFAERIKAL